MARYDVIAYDADGNTLSEGDVITADLDGVYAQNGIVKWYPAADTGVRGSLYRWDGSTYVQLYETDGDGSAFVVPGGSGPDRITVVSCTTDEIEFSCEWDAWDIDTGYLATPGIGYRDFHSPGPGLNYEQSTATPKYITETRLVKTSILRRGREGVFLGYHSDPRVGPLSTQLPGTHNTSGYDYNNATDWGEREFQCSGGAHAYVAFSSAGVSGFHPDFGADAIWGSSAGGANYATARHLWLGIDDPTSPPYDQAAYISHQHAGFPSEQTTGPWWVGVLRAENATTYPWCFYMTLRQRQQVGSYQFSPSARGQTTINYANEAHDAANVPYRTMCFIGAFAYTSADLTAEPTAALQAAVANRANDDFELSGQADIGVSTTTIGEVRNRMIRSLESATPTCFANRRFVAHREDVELTDFAERSPDASTRRFTVRDTFPGTTTIHTVDLKEIHTVIEVVVAYPKRGAFRTSGTSRPILELNDIIRADFQLMRETVGVRGFHQLEQDGINAAVTGEEWSVEQGTACVYSILRLPVMYREDPL